MLLFPYQDEPLTGRPPPSLPALATARWRPLVPVDILGPTGLRRSFARALVDPGADDTVFPLNTALQIGVKLLADTGHRVRWRGLLHPLRFGAVDLILEDGTDEWRWPAVVGFSPAPIRYPILGLTGCLEFFDTRFRGSNLIVEFDTNPAYPGTKLASARSG
ncbi:MAG: hypothetical protein JO112_02490 [Planctomycetes bacterium]|nr:hypothetical protein [Planctomycetota bacterium]